VSPERSSALGAPRHTKRDLIVVDTGDGVAIPCLNDIENAFLVAVKLCEYLSGNEPCRPIFEIARVSIWAR
jgi:hypothetical protein